MHHALKSRGGLEAGLGRVSIFGIHELGDHASSFLKVLQVLRNLENQRVGVSWELTVSFSVGHVAIFVPFLTEETVQLIVLHVDDKLVSRIIFIDELANSSHGLTWLAGNADRVHLPVVLC